MAMIWDALLVSALAEELKTLLHGKRLRGHAFRWSERELSLYFEEEALTWHLHPRKGWVIYTKGGGVPEEARALSAHIVDVRSPPDERILELSLRKPRGRIRAFRIVVELLTNQWNALLLDGETDVIRHLLWTRHSGPRSLSIGQRYTPPAPSTRLGIHAPLSEDEWTTLLQGKDPLEARRLLLDEVAFTSPINVGFLLGQQGSSGSPEADVRHGALEEDLPGALERWKRLRNPERSTACLLEIGGDRQPYPIVLKHFKSIFFPSILDAIHEVSGGADGRVDENNRVQQQLVRALDRARGRIKGIRREMDSAGDPEEVRSRANLLLARLRDVPRGAESVTLRGFNGDEVVVHLDPALSPQENAEVLYEEASRQERAKEKLPGLLERAESVLGELEGLRVALEEGTLSPEEVAGRIPGAKKQPGPSLKQDSRLPYRRFTSSGGLEIRVGRGSKDNDALTFRHSHPEDVWLHARGRAGAHVVLQWRKEGNPPQRDLAEAAVLAALHSGARSSGTVPVDWTRRKYVRKPRKAPPGTVVPDRVKTIFVEPDPDLPDRLSQKE